MSQTGEEAANTSIDEDEVEEEQDEELETVEIRYTMFFDGTLNNRNNIKIRLIASDDDLRPDEIQAKENLELYKASPEKIAKAKKTYGKHGASDPEDDNSYEGFFTNVEKMEKYLEDDPNYKLNLTSYIEGMGSIDNKGDQGLGFATAKGKSGIPKRVDGALDKIVSEITEKVNADQKITKIAIDVFGFSRGAASARYFLHKVLRDDENLQARIEKADCKINKGAKVVEVIFAGLYDTVSTYGLSVGWAFVSDELGIWGADNVEDLNLKAVRHAKKSFHITSADEHREFFSLTNIQSAGYKGKQIFLPGVHSDIGGGYRDSSDEKAFIFRGPRGQAEQDVENLVNQGWYKASDITFTDITFDDPNEDEEDDYLYTAVTVTRKKLSNAYSRIPLHLMAAEARSEEVSMKLKPKLERDEKIPDRLSEVKKEIDAYVARQGSNTSRAEDWLNNPAQWVKDLRYQYGHFSARIKTGHTPRMEGVERVRHEYNG